MGTSTGGAPATASLPPIGGGQIVAKMLEQKGGRRIFRWSGCAH